MIGLWGSDPYWRLLLDQEGVSYAVDTAADMRDAQVLVLDRAPTRSEALSLKRYVESGGALLAPANHASAVWPELRPRTTRLRYVAPDGSPLFRNVGIVDVETRGCICRGATAGTTDRRQAALVSQQFGRGWVVLLPFDPSAVLARTTATARQFPASTPRSLTETVSAVGRGDVRRLVANCLRSLLWRQGLPYVHLVYTPGGRSVFGFRVDTDFGPAADLKTTAALADRAGLPFTWFVNVGAHGGNLGFFNELESRGQDIQLHCHHHIVYRQYARNHANLKRGKAELQEAGIRPVGTAAPYGQWNRSLVRAFEQLGFAYSSEFGYSYDDLPSRPLVGGKPSSVLQVSVHPISIGRLMAARASKDAVYAYLTDVIDVQRSRGEPCFIYDHPGQIARHADLVTQVLKYGVRAAGPPMTMTSYAQWWHQREQLGFDLRVHGRSIEIAVRRGAGAGIGLQVELPECTASLPFADIRQSADALTWSDRLPAARLSHDWHTLRRTTARQRLRDAARRVRTSLQAHRS